MDPRAQRKAIALSIALFVAAALLFAFVFVGNGVACPCAAAAKNAREAAASSVQPATEPSNTTVAAGAASVPASSQQIQDTIGPRKEAKPEPCPFPDCPKAKDCCPNAAAQGSETPAKQR